MKRLQTALLVAVVAVLTLAIFNQSRVHAQGYGAIGFEPIAPTIANCPAGLANGTMLCTVGTVNNYAIYVSFNAMAYQLLVPPSTTAGITSFNGRTGPAITLTKADVLSAGISVATTVAPPTATSTLQ